MATWGAQGFDVSQRSEPPQMAPGFPSPKRPCVLAYKTYHGQVRSTPPARTFWLDIALRAADAKRSVGELRHKYTDNPMSATDGWSLKLRRQQQRDGDMLEKLTWRLENTLQLAELRLAKGEPVFTLPSLKSTASAPTLPSVGDASPTRPSQIGDTRRSMMDADGRKSIEGAEGRKSKMEGSEGRKSKVDGEGRKSRKSTKTGAAEELLKSPPKKKLAKRQSAPGEMDHSEFTTELKPLKPLK